MSLRCLDPTWRRQAGSWSSEQSRQWGVAGTSGGGNRKLAKPEKQLGAEGERGEVAPLVGGPQCGPHTAG